MPFEKGQTPAGAEPFQQGQSGNPSGRPKGSRNRSTVVRELLETIRKAPDLLASLNPNLTDDYTTEQIITLAQIEKAAAGDTNAYKALMDSAYGAPKQQIGGEGDDEPIKTEVTHRLTPGDVDAFKAFFNGKY